MNIIILTGNELRHEFFRKFIANDSRVNVLATYCEGNEQSLMNRTVESGTELELYHVKSREQSEQDFFEIFVDEVRDKSNPYHIPKGDINDIEVVKAIKNKSPDLIVCYGASIINSDLLSEYKGRFLNVHLGLSPYYRGSGTNIWPLINGEPEMVGATFMYIDEGIDTGEIIHQIRAEIHLGDTIHMIGNRLIKNMTRSYLDIIVNYKKLTSEEQPKSAGKLYFQKDFDKTTCKELYSRFSKNMISDFLKKNKNEYKPIVENAGLLK